MPSANDLLQSRGVSHAIQLQRLATSQVNDVLAALNVVDRDLTRAIASRAGESFTKERLEALLREIREINTEAAGVLNSSMRDAVASVGSYEAAFQVQRINEALPIAWDIVQPSPAAIQAAVLETPFANRLLSQHIDDVIASRQRLIEGALRTGFIEGETIDQMTRRIRGTRAARYTDGLLERSRREVRAIVRTATNHTASRSRELTYTENSDLIKGVQYVATLDARTTTICASLDGKVFDMNDGPRPPQHFNCRSTTVPVIKSWRELGIDRDELDPGTRASMNGQVSERTTYSEWLKDQSSDVQRDVLGAQRYELFRDGTSFDRFINDDGRFLTLDQLRQREGIA